MNKIRQCVRKERRRDETKRMIAEGKKMTLGERRLTPQASRKASPFRAQPLPLTTQPCALLDLEESRTALL